MPLNLELKRPGYESLLARFLADRGRRRDVIVASFFDRAGRAFRRHAPGIDTAPGRLSILAFCARAGLGFAPHCSPHVALQVPERQWGMPVTDARLVRAAHRAGLAVHVWTVNEPAAIERLVGLGVTAS